MAEVSSPIVQGVEAAPLTQHLRQLTSPRSEDEDAYVPAVLAPHPILTQPFCEMPPLTRCQKATLPKEAIQDDSNHFALQYIPDSFQMSPFLMPASPNRSFEEAARAAEADVAERRRQFDEAWRRYSLRNKRVARSNIERQTLYC